MQKIGEPCTPGPSWLRLWSYFILNLWQCFCLDIWPKCRSKQAQLHM